MSKYYRVKEDDFKALSFCSDMDEWWEDHALVIKEQCKEEFIAEQIARFTRHLLSILHEMPTRGEHNPFNRVSKKYPREHAKLVGDFIICPKCRTKIDEEEWNSNTDDTRSCCPNCEYEFEMEKEEE